MSGESKCREMVPESQTEVSLSPPEGSCFAQSRKSTKLIQTAFCRYRVGNNPPGVTGDGELWAARSLLWESHQPYTRDTT